LLALHDCKIRVCEINQTLGKQTRTFVSAKLIASSRNSDKVTYI